MKLSKHKRRNLLELNMTPMIDVVFQLLIFFMAISSQVSQYDRSPLELPKLPGAEDQQPTTITVNVDEKGTILVANEPLSMPEFVSLISDGLSKAGGDPTLVTVVIRADRRGASRTVNEVVTVLRRMQIIRVRFAVEVPK